jgi:hypothetical protein
VGSLYLMGEIKGVLGNPIPWIPVCPEEMGRKEEPHSMDTCMP